LGGCATVTRGTTTQFAVESTPPGAKVTTSTGFSCSPTPCHMKMSRKEPFDATVSLDGYAPQTTHISSKVGGAGAAGMAGNVILGGVIGIGVDAASGAIDDLSPNPLKVTLMRAPADPSAGPAASAAPAASDATLAHQ
jgi:hypothetical protein